MFRWPDSLSGLFVSGIDYRGRNVIYMAEKCYHNRRHRPTSPPLWRYAPRINAERAR